MGRPQVGIDPQELFYLRSRGLPISEAEELIALGFLKECLDGIEHHQNTKNGHIKR